MLKLGIAIWENAWFAPKKKTTSKDKKNFSFKLLLKFKAPHKNKLFYPIKYAKANYNKDILDFRRILLRNIKIIYINVNTLFLLTFGYYCKEILRKIYKKEQFFI